MNRRVPPLWGADDPILAELVEAERWRWQMEQEAVARDRRISRSAWLMRKFFGVPPPTDGKEEL